MTEAPNWNQRTIDEFRAHKGKVGGIFEGKHLLLLSSIGAKSGQRRINPLAYLPDGDRLIIFATKRGAPTNPDWYYNLLAHPEATVEVGTEEFAVTASVVQGAERDQLYARQVAVTPAFGDYEQKTSRKIPVIALKRHR